MELGHNIRSLRKEAGLTQEELAEKLGLQKSAIAKYESGRVNNIKRATILKMCEIFDCNPSVILGIDEEPTHLGKPEADIDAAIIKEATELSNIYMHLNEEDRADLLKFARRLAR